MERLLESAEKSGDLAIEVEENVENDGEDTLPVSLPLLPPLPPHTTGNPAKIKTPDSRQSAADPPFKAPAPLIQAPGASLETPKIYTAGGAGATSGKRDGVRANEEPVGVPPSWVSGWGKILNDITERLPPLQINDRYFS